MVSVTLRRKKKKENLTTHDVVQLYVFEGRNFSLEFERGAVAQENSLKERKWNEAVDFFCYELWLQTFWVFFFLFNKTLLIPAAAQFAFCTSARLFVVYVYTMFVVCVVFSAATV